MKLIVYLDMDGVLANFEKAIGRPYVRGTDPEEMYVPGFFRGLEVMPGAKEAVAKLMAAQYLSVYIASKPVDASKSPHNFSEKAAWIAEHFPALANRINLICDKGLLNGAFLIDDDADRWKKKFKGHFIHFDQDRPEASWLSAVQTIDEIISGVSSTERGERYVT